MQFLKNRSEKKDSLHLLVNKAYLSEDGKDFYLTNVVKIRPVRRFPGGSRVIAKCQHWNVSWNVADFNLHNSTPEYCILNQRTYYWVESETLIRFALTLKNLETDNNHSIYFKTLISLSGFQCQIWKFNIQKKKTLRYTWRIYTLMSTVFKCSSAECILTRRCSPSCNHAYQCLVTKINMTMN